MTEHKPEYAIEVHRPALVSTFDEAARAASAMAQSGYFSDARDVAQAMVKVLAGFEMGFGPFASMNGIHIIQGKPSVGANLMAAAVKQHPRYNYEVKTLTAELCELVFWEGEHKLGISTFSIKDARETKYYDSKKKTWIPLANKHNWQNYARNMLFARAISNGVRWYTPDVFGGSSVYTPDELDEDAPEPDWDVVDGEVTEQKPEPEPESIDTHDDALPAGGNRNRDRLFKTEQEPEADDADDADEGKSIGPPDYWRFFHHDGPKAAGVAQKYAANIAQKYGEGEGDWNKAKDRLIDAMNEVKAEAEQ